MKNLYLVRIIPAFLFCLLAATNAISAPATYVLDSDHSGIEFEFESTLHTVHGTADQIEGAVVFDAETGHVTALPETVIHVTSLSTDNKARDRGMQKMFNAVKFPMIRWEADSLNCPPLTVKEPVRCEASGGLRIRDVRHEIRFPVTLSGDPAEEIRSEGLAVVSLKDFGLKPPSVLGVIRVYDQVSLKINTLWTRKAAS